MIDWKNWKGGAKIGFVYGLICAIYFLPILLAQYAPAMPNPIFLPYDDPNGYLYTLIGFIIFLPLFFFASVIIDPFYLSMNVFEIILSFSLIVIILGTVLVAVIGHLVYLRNSKLKKS